MESNTTENQGEVKAEEPVIAPAPDPIQEPVSEPVVEAAPAAPADKDAEENKFVAALSYLGILFLVPLLAKKDSPFAQFHAKQGLVLCIGFFVFSFIPFFGWLANLVLLVVAIIAIIQTLSAKRFEIPFVKDLAAKINL